MSTHNDIFIISNNIDRLLQFKKYYNIFNYDTDARLNVIIDNRKTDLDVSQIRDTFNIYYTKDMLKEVKPLFNNFDHPDMVVKILDIYGVAIKWLVFPYIHKILNIEKAMMMDDDVFLLQPIDEYFKKDYVYYGETVLGVMSKGIENTLNALYSEYLDITKMREKPAFCLNSGQIIHKDNDMLMTFLNKAFHPDVYNLLVFAVEKYKAKAGFINNNNKRNIGGKFWILEQNIYSIYYRWLSENGYDVTLFGPEVKVKETLLKPFDISRIRKLPKYIHYLPTDKTPLYEIYAKQIDRIINGEVNVPR
jgi:hypothetical protein